MSLDGRIEDLGVAELLYVVGVSRRSGLLRLEGRQGDFEFLFREGSIIASREARDEASLRELIVRRGLSDDLHVAVLERQASRDARSLEEVLEEEGVLPAGGLEELLREETEDRVQEVLQLRAGRFEFELVQDEARTAEDHFGGLVLKEGLAPGRLDGISEGTRAGGGSLLGGGLSLPKSVGRRAQLLLDDSSLSLPALPGAASRRGPDTIPSREEAASGPLFVLAVSWPALARRLQHGLDECGFRVARARTTSEAAELAIGAHEAGQPVTVIGDVTLSALPGLELVARTKLAARATRTVLLLDARGSAAQRASHRLRAESLGVTHVILQAGDESDRQADEAAAELLELLTREETQRPAEPAPVHPVPDGIEVPEGWQAAEARLTRRLSSVEPAEQETLLAGALRELASLRSAPAVNASLLELALEYLPRALLFARSDDGVRAVGVAAASGDEQARLGADLLRRQLDPQADDLPCACLRDGRSRKVPAELAGTDLLDALGGARPEQLVAIPLLFEQRPVAVLVLDDAGAADWPDTAAFERFLASAATVLGGALEREARAVEVRRIRANR